MSFGNELKAAREGLGLSIQDVAQSTKIRSDYLKALESENFAALPERPFARSYLQNFARELRLDSVPLLHDFDRQLPQPKVQTQRPTPRSGAAAGAARSGFSGGVVGGVLGGLLLLGLVGYVGYTAYQSRTVHNAASQTAPVTLPNTRQVRLNLASDPSGARVYIDNRYLGLTPVQNFPLDARPKAALRVEYGGRQTHRESVALTADRHLSVKLLPETAASRAAEKLAAQQAAANPATPAPTPVPKPTAGTPTPTSTAQQPANPGTATPVVKPVTPPTPTKGVRLSFSGASWTRVTDQGGRVLYEGIPAAGSSRDFPSGVTVRTGSAGRVSVSVAGSPASPLGSVGQVVTRKF